MRLGSFGVVPLIVVLAVAVGCTHVQLRKNTVRQAETLSDIYEQQVLDNLAMFARDYHALPHFAFPNQGTSTLTDSGGISSTISWIPEGFGGASLTPTLSRSNNEAWTLTPIADPRVLELMRCAYQRTVRSCCPQAMESGGCPDCEKRFKKFYTGDPAGEIPAPGTADDTGTVTTECLKSDCCWFHLACAKCLPKYSKCCKVGHYCGVYVCVSPGRGQDELSKLTLVILDFAVNQGAKSEAPPTQEVVQYFKSERDQGGTRWVPATQATAEKVVTQTVEAAGESTQPKGMLRAKAIGGGYMLPERGPRPNPSSLPQVLEYRQQLRAPGVL